MIALTITDQAQVTLLDYWAMPVFLIASTIRLARGAVWYLGV